jgi:hypothetical protein
MAPHQITILYFIIGSLKILDNLINDDINLCIEFVLNNAVINDGMIKGFRGGTFTGFTYNKEYIDNKVHIDSDLPHIAATYCSLCMIKMCDINKIDLERKLLDIYGYSVKLDEQFLLKEIKDSQKEYGNISCQNWDCENDVRFFFCACAIHRLLDYYDYEINVEKGLKYLDSLINYEGGFSMVESGESNGIAY